MFSSPSLMLKPWTEGSADNSTGRRYELDIDMFSLKIAYTLPVHVRLGGPRFN